MREKETRREESGWACMYIPDKGGGGEQNCVEKKVGGGRGSGGGVALGWLVAVGQMYL